MVMHALARPMYSHAASRAAPSTLGRGPPGSHGTGVACGREVFTPRRGDRRDGRVCPACLARRARPFRTGLRHPTATERSATVRWP